VKQALQTVVLGLAAALTLAGCSCTTGSGPRAASRLEGGGSTFIGPMMQEWAALYEKETGVQVDYTLGGSGKGISSMINRTYDFGCSDAPANKDQLEEARKNGGAVVHIPLAMGAIVPAYNLREVEKPLKFTGPVLARIYLGQITKWNDPALKELNPGVDLPDKSIVVVRRSDPSGSTFIFTNYLDKVSDEWKKSKLGYNTEINWPAGVGDGAKGTDGVAAQVASTPGAIGYIELLYAMKNQDKIRFGSVRNKRGQDKLASLEAVTAAAEGGLQEVPDDLCVILTDMDGDEAYPICGMVWAVMYVQQPPDKGKALADFFTWVVHDGQEHTAGLHYARLPAGLVSRVEKKLAALQK
jgi:phosphate ABC transporter phosphate-binding protein